MDVPRIMTSVFLQAFMFVVVLSFRDAIKQTMTFVVPGDETGITWIWILAIIHILLALVFVFVLSKFRLIDMGLIAPVAVIT
jgi:hypothetical protein